MIFPKAIRAYRSKNVRGPAAFNARMWSYVLGFAAVLNQCFGKRRPIVRDLRRRVEVHLAAFVFDRAALGGMAEDDVGKRAETEGGIVDRRRRVVRARRRGESQNADERKCAARGLMPLNVPQPISARRIAGANERH